MPQTISQTEEESYKQFEQDFKEWVTSFAPTGDHTALQAIAWNWYRRGRRVTVRRVSRALNEVANDLSKDDFY